MTCKDCIHYDICLLERDDEIDKVTADGLFKIAERDCAYFKDKQKLVELPCRVGDTVYHLQDVYKGKKRVNSVIEPIMVDSFVIGDSGTLQVNTCNNERNIWRYYELCDFGRYVFLTREEAEKALEKDV